MAEDVAKPPFLQQVKSFPRAFWVANSIELVERFSFYGVRSIAALYIVAAAEEGGLGFDNTATGIFFGVWSLIQCLLPMFTGGFSDRYGYRVSLFVAYTINIIGYGLMAFVHSWWGFMAACCLIGTGTAIFKPPLHGTLAHAVDERNSSVGWGIFYQVVNIGGFLGPVVTGYLRLLEWRYAFFASASIILVNVMITGLFLKDYSKETQANAQDKKGPWDTFVEAITTLKDLKFSIFLAIFSGFYFMFMQLWDRMPVFISQYVDSNDVLRWADGLLQKVGVTVLSEVAAQGGQVNPEWMINLDAAFIILLMLPIAYLAGKFHPISAMIVGMFVAAGGLLMAGVVSTGWLCVLAIFIFALGEMACSPKFSEYVGLMAPPEKKALYMGYSNLPFAFGWAGANFIGGPLYDALSDRVKLARRYLVDELQFDTAQVEEMTRGEVLPALQGALRQSEAEITQLMWDTYSPQSYWYICVGIGFFCTFAMVGYHFWLKAYVKRREAEAAA